MEETNTNTKLNFLNGGGEMGKLIRSKDWSKTPLGSPDTWPQSLRTSVGLCLSSPFPILIAWGPETIQIYNDSYRPICGAKHPESLGQNFRICWETALPVVGDAFTRGQHGEGTYIKDQRMFLDRFGYLEEAFMTFSFTPITDESGKVGGIFHPITESTGQMLSARRTQVLRNIAEYISDAKSNQDTYKQITEAYNEFCLDIPFLLFYKLDEKNESVSLESAVGVSAGLPLSEEAVSINSPQQVWPFKEALDKMQPVVVKGLREKFGEFVCGPYPEAPNSALVFPIQIASREQPFGFFVAGVSARRELDHAYSNFYDLLSNTVNTAFSNIYSYEQERKRAEALAEIDKAKTVFFSNISHEFRTPLTLILGPLEELLNKKDNNFSESEIGNLESTHRNGIRLLKLVNTLLDFSRVESGRQQGVFSLVDIITITKNLASNFRSVIEKADLKLEVKADSIIQPMYVDIQMWEKIVFNLLSNAFKYTLEGKISVELSAEKDFAVLKVRDTGIGIPEAELPNMFERFHREQNVSGRTYEGTGIGLSLIKELVQIHHGTIEVESKLNEGSVFIVKIPYGKGHLNEQQISQIENDAYKISNAIYIDEAQALLDAELLEAKKSIENQNRPELPTILVVEDNADMRLHLRSILSAHFNVITASNGLDALRKIKESKPTLVLSDIMMPVMDGMDLLKEIRSNKATENIPVIFLTARAGEESRIEGWETGADDYLVKPFSRKELLARIQAQINIIKLRKSLESNIRNLFMEAPAIICVLRGSSLVYEIANEEYLNLIGKKDVIGKTVREVLPELEGQGFFEILDTVYATGEPFIGNEIPAQLDKGNGKLEEVYMNFIYQPSKNSKEEIDGIFVHGVDVTEQVLARKKIEENENKLQNIFLNAPAAIAIFEGPEHKYVLANKAYEKLSNRKAADLLGKSMQVLFPELEGTGTLELFDKVLETGESYSFPEYALMLDLKNKGVLRQYYFNFSMEPLKNNSGEIYGVMAVTYDITEKVEARKKIKENEKRFSNLLMESPFAFAILKGEDKVVSLANDAIKGVWGKGGDIEGKSLLTLMPEIKEQGFATLLEQVYITGKPFYGHEELVKLERNGIWEDVYFNFIFQPYKEADETISGVTIIANEVTTQAIANKSIVIAKENVSRLFMQAPAVICVLRGPQHIVELANSHYYRFVGKSDMLGKTIREGLPELEGQGFFEILDNVYTTGEPFIGNEMPAKFDRGAGRPEDAFVNFVYQASHNNEGEIDGILVHAVDVTEQVLARKKIEESEKYFRQLTDTVPAIIWITEPDGSCSYLNKNWYSYTGQTEAEALSFGWLDATHPDDKEETGRLFLEANAAQKSFMASYRLKVKNGDYRWAIDRGSPKFGEDGQYEGMIGTVVDVHEEKLAADKILDSEKQFNTLANNIQNLAWIADGNGWIYWYNQQWFDYTGTTMEEMRGLGWEKLLHPDHVDRVVNFVSEAWKINIPWELIYPIRGIDGLYRTFLTRANPVYSDEGKITHWIGTNTDIEQQKQNDDRKDEFISIASHELKTPLTTAKAYLQMLEFTLEDDNTEANLYSQKANESVNRLDELITELLDVSKIRLGKLTYSITNFDFNDMVERTVKNMQLILPTHTIIKTGEVCNSIYGDKERLQQVLINLLSNAVKYSPGEEKVFLHVEQDEEMIKVSIRDNGIGIGKKNLNNIFDKYHRIEEQAIHFQGLGIGLYISHEIIQRHEGKLWAESELGKGSIFYFTLPMTNAESSKDQKL
ncbi:ATP-binding protein [Algoriphagus sp.]|uniref:ATP-binding protein n=1 Tax=Algoriphagus sp. TaxID=1872435 RepID=UPI00391CB55D